MRARAREAPPLPLSELEGQLDQETLAVLQERIPDPGRRARTLHALQEAPAGYLALKVAELGRRPDIRSAHSWLVQAVQGLMGDQGLVPADSTGLAEPERFSEPGPAPDSPWDDDEPDELLWSFEDRPRYSRETGELLGGWVSATWCYRQDIDPADWPITPYADWPDDFRICSWLLEEWWWQLATPDRRDRPGFLDGITDALFYDAAADFNETADCWWQQWAAEQPAEVASDHPPTPWCEDPGACPQPVPEAVAAFALQGLLLEPDITAGERGQLIEDGGRPANPWRLYGTYELVERGRAHAEQHGFDERILAARRRVSDWPVQPWSPAYSPAAGQAPSSIPEAGADDAELTEGPPVGAPAKVDPGRPGAALRAVS